MDKTIFLNFPLDEFEDLQKTWITEVLNSTKISKEKDEELLTREETANILGISLPTLNEYSKKGIIPAYRIGSRVRYKKSEILNSLESFQKYGRRFNLFDLFDKFFKN